MQVLWFESDEIGIILICFMLGAIFKGWFWLLVIVGPYFYSRSKLKYPRGFLKHVLYLSGIKDLHSYPSTFEKAFYE